MSVSIRKYTDRDFEDYARTLLLTWPFESISEARENVEVGVERARAGGENNEIWVAVVEGVAASFMLLEFYSDSPTDTRAPERQLVEIDWLDVHPQYERKGAGMALVKKAEERAVEKQCRSITIHTEVNNRTMMRLAEKCGFVNTQVLKDFWGKGRGDAVLLVKSLRFGPTADVLE